MEHNKECTCERCLLLDEIIKVAGKMGRCVVSKFSGDYVRSFYWELKPIQEEMLKKLKELNANQKLNKN